MSLFNVHAVSMCQVEELGARELMNLFNPYRHDPSALYEHVTSFSRRLQLDESEVDFFISELKSRYRFEDGDLAHSIAMAMIDYVEMIYRREQFYEETNEDFFQQYMDLSF